MSPSRRVPIRAFLCAMAVLTSLAASASAQALYEDVQKTLDFSTDPLFRAPRQLGMGGLTLVGPDPHIRITMWDFAGNATGVGAADSMTTLEVRPFTSAFSSERDIVGTAPLRERQDLAAREVRIGFEVWRRPVGGDGPTFGAIGSINRLRVDRPVSADVEQRSRFTVPDATFAVNGPMPSVMPERMHYALRATWRNQTNTDTYRSVFSNAAGEFVDKKGGLLPVPELFTPDDILVKTFGLGAAASYTWGDPLVVALGYDYESNELNNFNTGSRHESEIREDRPFNRGQLSMVGTLGGKLNYGADLRAWSSNSDQSWVFTISAGPGNPPLIGRGNLQTREEKGRSANARARLFAGRFELGAGAHYLSRDISTTAPALTDPTSFNAFRNQLFHATGADTLTLPDSILANAFGERSWGAGVGLAWTSPGERTVVGAEYHMSRNDLESDLNGAGPERLVWDARGGIEYVWTPVLTLRGGYMYRSEDRDELTQQNENLANAVTLGFGFQPPGARWKMNAGYAFEWGEADYGDPSQPRTSRQRLGTQILWAF